MPTDEMFGLRRNYLRTVTDQSSNRRRCDDGQVPTGWQMPADWHLSSGKFNCRTSGALPTSQQRLKLRANVYGVME
jgi:hypothetical protein